MNLILASTSTVYGKGYLVYLKETLEELYKNVEEIIFIPFARPGGISHDEYTAKAKEGLAFLNKKVVGLHEKKDKIAALQNAEGIFTGGGNTFLLVHQLYEHNLMQELKSSLLSGTPYLGTSAGSNICGLSMKTTNDMPIIYPPSFETMGIIPFNLNVHYLDPDPNSTHQGETRETRIKEFQNLNKIPVVGLREGSWLKIIKDDIILEGPLKARIFKSGEKAYEIDAKTSLKNLA